MWIRKRTSRGSALADTCARALLVCLFLVSTSAGLFAEPGSARARERPGETRAMLAGRTEIRASRPISVPVRLDRDASVSLDWKPHSKRGPTRDVSIEGKGRAVGIFLIPDPAGASLVTERGLLAGRFAYCDRKACDPGGAFVNFQFPFAEEGGTHVLKKGDYRLHVVADSAPVVISLRLKGLHGRTVITGSDSPPIHLQTPRPRYSSSNLHSAGSLFRTGDHGVVIGMLAFRGDPSAPYNYGLCQYGDLEPPDDLAYGPHCYVVGGLDGHLGMRLGVDRFSFVFLRSYGPDSLIPSTDGERRLGLWISSPAEIRSPASQMMTLELQR